MSFKENEKNLIIGNNGAGKSTFVSAICYALYGVPYKSVLKPTIINSINKKNLLVEIDFSIGSDKYKIKRGMKPNLFEIYVNGKMLNQDGKAKDYQSYLEKNILKMNFNTFKQIVVIGNTGFTPFMKLEATKRREMVENILDLEIFSKMNSIAKDNLSSTKKEYELAISDFDFEKRMLSSKERNLEVLEENLNKQTEDMILDVDKKIRDVNELLEKIPTNFPDFESKLFDLDNARSKMLKHQASLESTSSYLKKEESLLACMECPTCKREIDEIFKKQKQDELTLKQEKNKENLNKTLSALSAVNEKISKTREKKNTVEKLSARRQNLETEILRFSSEKERLLSKMKEENSDLSPLRAEINDMSLSLDEKQKQIDLLRNDIELKKFALVVLKDDGIKSKIVSTYIPLINDMINKYLDLMNFYVSFEIDENFNEVIKSRHRDIFTYDNFSDGERSRIDLAFLFAWREITRLRNSISCNLLILDEVFSGSLDGVGIDDLMSILKGIENTNVFVITHRVDCMDQFENVYKFTKEKNFTQVERLKDESSI